MQIISKIEVPKIQMALYGLSGSGKTTFAAKGIKKAVIIDFDHGMTSLYGIDYDATILKCDSNTDFFDALNYIEENDKNIETVIFDGFSVYSLLVKKAVFELAKQEDPKDWKKKTLSLWGDVGEVLIDKMNTLLSINKNILVLFEEDTYKNEETGFIARGLGLAGNKARQSYPYKFDIVGRAYTYKKEKKKNDLIYTIQTDLDNDYIAKNRLKSIICDKKLGGSEDIKTFQELIDTFKNYK